MISKETFLAVFYTSFYLNIFCLLFGLALLKNQRRKEIIIIVYLILSISFDYISEHVMDWFGLSTNFHIHNMWSFIEFIVLWIFYFQIFQFLNKLDTHLLRKSLFWQNSAFFIYFTGNILMFLMVDYMFLGDIGLLNSWAIHNILTIIKALGLIIAFYINTRYYSENRI